LCSSPLFFPRPNATRFGPTSRRRAVKPGHLGVASASPKRRPVIASPPLHSLPLTTPLPLLFHTVSHPCSWHPLALDLTRLLSSSFDHHLFLASAVVLITHGDHHLHHRCRHRGSVGRRRVAKQRGERHPPHVWPPEGPHSQRGGGSDDGKTDKFAMELKPSTFTCGCRTPKSTAAQMHGSAVLWTAHATSRCQRHRRVTGVR
jgi:hypothetical protein